MSYAHIFTESLCYGFSHTSNIHHVIHITHLTVTAPILAEGIHILQGPIHLPILELQPPPPPWIPHGPWESDGTCDFPRWIFPGLFMQKNRF